MYPSCWRVWPPQQQFVPLLCFTATDDCFRPSFFIGARPAHQAMTKSIERRHEPSDGRSHDNLQQPAIVLSRRSSKGVDHLHHHRTQLRQEKKKHSLSSSPPIEKLPLTPLWWDGRALRAIFVVAQTPMTFLGTGAMVRIGLAGERKLLLLCEAGTTEPTGDNRSAGTTPGVLT